MTAKVRRIDFSPDEWLGGTQRLSYEEEGFYIRICTLIYSHGGPLPMSDVGRICRADPRQTARLLQRLIVLRKIIENDDDTITVPRCEVELAAARHRSEQASNNSAKRWKNHKRDNANGGAPAVLGQNGHDRQPPADFARTSPRSSREVPEMSHPMSHPKPLKSRKSAHPRARNANHQPSGRKVESPKELSSLSSAPCASPPLPSQGDGVAAPGAATPEPAADATGIDPALLAYGLAKFDECLEILNGKQFVFDSDARVPPPPGHILEFRARLARINTVVGERMRGNERSRAWDIIGQADAIGDPERIPPDMLAALDSLEGAA